MFTNTFWYTMALLDYNKSESGLLNQICLCKRVKRSKPIWLRPQLFFNNFLYQLKKIVLVPNPISIIKYDIANTFLLLNTFDTNNL